MTTTYQNGTTTQNGAAEQPGELVRELYGGEIYEYYPLGKYIVRAPGVCGGRPTFKYTRLEPSVILAQLSFGRTVAEVVAAYQPSRVTVEGVYEAVKLANQAFMALHRTALPQPEEPELALP
uniref:DUF433 domain-containing protein n=1 Tax=uncultured bacterium A1Q1_fos_1246 TaxID=1256545 RepID=L7W096_9BACT|nr:hypothetical protein [uncultured bacterium A1Q1_fos_1246]